MARDRDDSSSVPGAMASVRPNVASLLALHVQLDGSQWLTSGELQGMQLRQLGHVVRHANSTVPFHQQRFAAAGINVQADLSRELFERLPIMTRSDVQSQGEALRSGAMPPGHGYTVRGETSGSTGRPITYWGTGLTQLYWNACTLRDHRWHRRDFSAKLAAIRKDMSEALRPSWGPPADLVFQTGSCATLNLATDLDAQLDWLQRQAPAYLITAAYNLYWLARRALQRGLKLPSLREVRAYGGALPADARAVFREAWNVPLVDVYTAEEVGYIALQCPDHEHYHVQSENVIVEILDDSGQPCRPGEIGRVVLTTLHNFAMPLIRYEIGDYAESGAPCSCGRALPVISRILGRQRNILTLPDGRQRWPSFPSEKWSHAAPVRQIQLVQTSRDHIEIRVVAERTLQNGEREKLIGALQGCLGHTFAMEIVEVAKIPRSASYKFEDFISEIATP